MFADRDATSKRNIIKHQRQQRTMSENDISTATYGNLENTGTDYSVAPQTTDGPSESKETEYINQKWSQQLGYYKEIPELRTSIDALARWSIGKGYQAKHIAHTLTAQLHQKNTFNGYIKIGSFAKSEVGGP